MDLASMVKAVEATGGELYFYPKFEAHRNGEKLYYDLFRNLSRQYGTEVSVRARCSKGLSITEYFGGFGLRNSIELSLASIDSDKTIGFTIRNDTTFKEDQHVYV